MLIEKLRKGEYISEHKLDDGRTIKFRGPRSGDVSDMLKFINGLVEEKAMILANKKFTRAEEAEYVKSMVKENKKGEGLHIVAEVDGHVVAKAEITRKRYKSNHVGTLGIAISKGYRDVGLGKMMIGQLSELSKEYGLRMVLLEAFAENKRALHVYEKMGFKKVGYLPKDVYHKGKYMDSVIMAKEHYGAT